MKYFYVCSFKLNIHIHVYVSVCAYIPFSLRVNLKNNYKIVKIKFKK